MKTKDVSPDERVESFVQFDMFALAIAETKTAVHRATLVRRVVPTIRERFFSSIDRDMKDRDAAAEAAYIHERDLQALKALSKKVCV